MNLDNAANPNTMVTTIGHGFEVRKIRCHSLSLSSCIVHKCLWRTAKGCFQVLRWTSSLSFTFRIIQCRSWFETIGLYFQLSGIQTRSPAAARNLQRPNTTYQPMVWNGVHPQLHALSRQYEYRWLIALLISSLKGYKFPFGFRFL
jgi:hypothetical protein